MTGQLPDGYRIRPIALAEADGFLDGPDVDLAYAVARQVEDALLDEPDSSRETTRHLLTSPEAVLDEHRLVLDLTGRPVGLLIVEIDHTGHRIFLDPLVLPGEPLLPALLDVGIAAAERLGGNQPGWQVETSAYEHDGPYRAALEAAGFTAIRRFWRMRIDFDGPVAEPVPPPGVTRAVATSTADRRLLHSIFESAFADHFGSVPERYEAWFGWISERRDALPQTWWLVWLDDEPVAGVTQDASRMQRGLGYVRTLGVLPSGRRRGIASWLLRCAFADAASRGMRGMALTVDSESMTGATGLYAAAGMRAEQVIDLFQRPLVAPGSMSPSAGEG